jgi:hypothetical protein
VGQLRIWPDRLRKIRNSLFQIFLLNFDDSYSHNKIQEYYITQ